MYFLKRVLSTAFLRGCKLLNSPIFTCIHFWLYLQSSCIKKKKKLQVSFLSMSHI